MDAVRSAEWKGESALIKQHLGERDVKQRGSILWAMRCNPAGWSATLNRVTHWAAARQSNQRRNMALADERDRGQLSNFSCSVNPHNRLRGKGNLTPARVTPARDDVPAQVRKPAALADEIVNAQASSSRLPVTIEQRLAGETVPAARPRLSDFVDLDDARFHRQPESLRWPSSHGFRYLVCANPLWRTRAR